MITFLTYDYNNFNAYQWPYLILKLTNYLKRKSFKKYKLVLIDPGVYYLLNHQIYKWELDTYQKSMKFIIKLLDSLPKNHYFSWDYPSDMNPQYQDFFLERTWSNACHLCYHQQYIVTVQYKFNNFWSFQEWFDRYNDLPIASNFMGLGNICKQKGLSEFIKHAIPYAFKNGKCKFFHIYGANKKSIPFINKMAIKYNKDVSIDNRKWEYYKPSSERPSWFRKYIENINSQGVIIRD